MKKAILTIAVHNKDTGKTIFLEREIDYIPSKGLYIYEPVVGTIGNVAYENQTYLASLESVMEPTNPEEQLAHLKSIGFTPKK